jgi:hypothetical protein
LFEVPTVNTGKSAITQLVVSEKQQILPICCNPAQSWLKLLSCLIIKEKFDFLWKKTHSFTKLIVVGKPIKFVFSKRSIYISSHGIAGYSESIQGLDGIFPIRLSLFFLT